jgi:hypothetical protein
MSVLTGRLETHFRSLVWFFKDTQGAARLTHDPSY